MLYVIYLLVFLCVLGIVVECIGEYMVGNLLVVIPPFVLIPIFIFHLIVITVHCDDIAFIRNKDSLLLAHTQLIENISIQMEDLNKSLGKQSLFNADCPYKTLIEQKSEVVKKLAHTRICIVQVQNDIQARKMGLMSHIVRWYGDK